LTLRHGTFSLGFGGRKSIRNRMTDSTRHREMQSTTDNHANELQRPMSSMGAAMHGGQALGGAPMGGGAYFPIGHNQDLRVIASTLEEYYKLTEQNSAATERVLAATDRVRARALAGGVDKAELLSSVREALHGTYGRDGRGDG
jgi:hypothetical protein